LFIFSNDRFPEGKALKQNKAQINHTMRFFVSGIVVKFVGENIFGLIFRQNEFDVADADNVFNQTNLALLNQQTHPLY
jgi:hypothetical protein